MQQMKMRVARLGLPATSEHDGPTRVVPPAVRELPTAVCERVLAARTTKISAELCFPAFFEGGGAIRPWQH